MVSEVKNKIPKTDFLKGSRFNTLILENPVEYMFSFLRNSSVFSAKSSCEIRENPWLKNLTRYNKISV